MEKTLYQEILDELTDQSGWNLDDNFDELHGGAVEIENLLRQFIPETVANYLESENVTPGTHASRVQ